MRLSPDMLTARQLTGASPCQRDPRPETTRRYRCQRHSRRQDSDGRSRKHWRGLANEMVGGADRLREDTLAYAMMRMQFGKPIASFQSMKHKHADMLLEVELAKSAAYYAAASLDDGDDDAAATAHLAKACASDA